MKRYMKNKNLLSGSFALLACLVCLSGASVCFAQVPDTEYSRDVRIMVVYTQELRDANGGRGVGAKQVCDNYIWPSIRKLNEALQNSQVNFKVRLVRSVMIHYPEKKGEKAMENMLNDFIANKGKFDILPGLKDLYQVDICVLMVYGDGREAGMAAQVAAPRDRAYCIVKARPGMVGRYAMAHEIGHLFGGNHENTGGEYQGHVFNFKENGYYPHTIMAYGINANNGLITNPVPYFSNPNVNYKGRPTGVAKKSNVVKRFNSRGTMNRIKGNEVVEDKTTPISDRVRDGEYAEILASENITINKLFVVENGGTLQLVTVCKNPSIDLQRLDMRGPRAKVNQERLDLNCGGGAGIGGLRTGLAAEATAEAAFNQPAVYPNPFTGVVEIAADFGQASQAGLSVYDMQGVLIGTEQYNTSNLTGGNSSIKYDGTHLQPGVYLYKLQINGQETMGRFMKK